MRETAGRSQFEGKVLARAQAGVNGQHNRKRQGRFLVEDRDLLLLAVFPQLEVVFFQGGDRGATFVGHGDEHVHQLDVNFESGVGLLGNGDKAQNQQKTCSCHLFHLGSWGTSLCSPGAAGRNPCDKRHI